MTTHAASSIAMKQWDERPYAETEGTPKMTRANGADLYHGDIEGESTFELLMIYGDDGLSPFVGLERFVGRIGERQGSFAFSIDGAHQEGQVKATIAVIPGSATGDLKGLRGKGELAWLDEKTSSITLDYDFE